MQIRMTSARVSRLRKLQAAATGKNDQLSSGCHSGTVLKISPPTVSAPVPTARPKVRKSNDRAAASWPLGVTLKWPSKGRKMLRRIDGNSRKVEKTPAADDRIGT